MLDVLFTFSRVHHLPPLHSTGYFPGTPVFFYRCNARPRVEFPGLFRPYLRALTRYITQSPLSQTLRLWHSHLISSARISHKFCGRHNECEERSLTGLPPDIHTSWKSATPELCQDGTVKSTSRRENCQVLTVFEQHFGSCALTSEPRHFLRQALFLGLDH